jgi:putative membrane protein (TIGR04086 family)
MNNRTSLWCKFSVLLWGVAAGIVVGAVCTALCAAVILVSGCVPEQGLVFMVWGAVLCAAFTTGLVSGIASGRHGLWYGLCGGTVLYSILLLCCMAYGQQPSADTLLKLGGVLLSGMAGGICGVNRRLRY